VLGQVPGARLGVVRDARRIGLARPAVPGVEVGASPLVLASHATSLHQCAAKHEPRHGASNAVLGDAKLNGQIASCEGFALEGLDDVRQDLLARDRVAACHGASRLWRYSVTAVPTWCQAAGTDASGDAAEKPCSRINL